MVTTEVADAQVDLKLLKLSRALSCIERASHVTASSLGSTKGVQVHPPTNLARPPRLFRV